MNKKKENKINKDINTDAFQATIVNIMNKQVKVLSKGEVFSCLLPGSLISNKDSLVVGDEVEVGNAGNGQYKLIHVLPRKTALYRGNRRSPEEKVLVAANVSVFWQS